ncbi:MAG TPA: ABC transporter ATP-binding protein [Euzebya sp.]|nr:ABC transporter ATP-binding protein [Euzebya sp.]
MADAILELDDVRAGYGRAALVLRGLSVSVAPGELVCLVGPNGAGKSTVLRVASGLLNPRAGRIRLRGEDVAGMRAEKLLRHGVVHVLQGHSVFPEMTVAENVLLGAFTLRDKALVRQRADAVKQRYEVVADRWNGLAGLLSGGQQKIVEFARAMMLDPDVLLLDEPSCGLEPRAAAQIFDEVGKLRDAGKAILLVEQNARAGLGIADRGCVLDLGVVRTDGPARELLADPSLAALYLGAPPKVDTDDPAPTTGSLGAEGAPNR